MKQNIVQILIKSKFDKSGTAAAVSATKSVKKSSAEMSLDLQVASQRTSKLKTEMSRLAASVASGNTPIDEARGKYEQLAQKLNKAEIEYRQLAQAEGLYKPGGAADQERTRFDRLKTGIAAAAAAYVAIQTAQRAWEAAAQGSVIIEQRERFDGLALSIGTTADVLEDRLTEATKGQASASELMAGANQLMLMGLTDSAGELERHFSIVSSLKKPHEDLGSALENWSMMLANQSLPRLDSYGISSGRVRQRIEELRAANEGMTREQAFTIATLEEAEKTMGKLGDSATGAGNQYKIAEAKWKDLVGEFQVGMAVGLEPLAQSFAEFDTEQFVEQLQAAAEFANDLFTALNTLGDWLDIVNTGANDAGLAINAMLREGAQNFVDFTEGLEGAESSTRDLSEAQENSYSSFRQAELAAVNEATALATVSQTSEDAAVDLEALRKKQIEMRDETDEATRALLRQAAVMGTYESSIKAVESAGRSNNERLEQHARQQALENSNFVAQTKGANQYRLAMLAMEKANEQFTASSGGAASAVEEIQTDYDELASAAGDTAARITEIEQGLADREQDIRTAASERQQGIEKSRDESIVRLRDSAATQITRIEERLAREEEELNQARLDAAVEFEQKRSRSMLDILSGIENERPPTFDDLINDYARLEAASGASAESLQEILSGVKDVDALAESARIQSFVEAFEALDRADIDPTQKKEAIEALQRQFDEGENANIEKFGVRIEDANEFVVRTTAERYMAVETLAQESADEIERIERDRDEAIKKKTDETTEAVSKLWEDANTRIVEAQTTAAEQIEGAVEALADTFERELGEGEEAAYSLWAQLNSVQSKAGELNGTTIEIITKYTQEGSPPGVPSSGSANTPAPPNEPPEYMLGGFTGGRASEIAGLVHGQELVIPESVRRQGVGALLGFATANDPLFSELPQGSVVGGFRPSPNVSANAPTYIINETNHYHNERVAALGLAIKRDQRRGRAATFMGRNA